MANTEIVNLNIGGVKCSTTYSTLACVPDCMLATYLPRWTEDGHEIFIDRDGATFKYILNYLRAGENAILPQDEVLLDELRLEAQFYQLHHLVKLVEKKIGCSKKQAETPSSTSARAKAQIQSLLFPNASAMTIDQTIMDPLNNPAQATTPLPPQTQTITYKEKSNVEGVKVERNGDSNGDTGNTTGAYTPVCTNSVCEWRGKCGVLQHSDQHMTDVWMCRQCYCTIALPQQRATLVVDNGGTVSKKLEQKQKLIIPVKTSSKKSMSPGPGPSNRKKRSAMKKSTVQRGKKRSPKTHKRIAHAKTNCGSVGRVHKCKECGRSYGKESLLKNHMKAKHAVTAHQCNICAKYFTHNSDLQRHISAVHQGAKPFQCPTCDKRFGWKGALNAHVKSIHQGEKFECHECGKKLSRKWNLVTHALIHTGEKPYVCDICGRGFTQPSNLAGHRRRHSN